MTVGGVRQARSLFCHRAQLRAASLGRGRELTDSLVSGNLSQPWSSRNASSSEGKPIVRTLLVI